jgi:predicted AAA+ superfamily ATPase
MPNEFIQRTIEPVIRKATREFPVVVLTGPRQSGKTTLLQHLFAKKYRYISLEPPDVRAAASSDPRGFLQMYSPPVIFDEVQYAPDLFPYIKEAVDAARDKPGQYLLTGSQNLLVMERVTESLAGRAAMLRLLPLSRREEEQRSRAPLPWEVKQRRAAPRSIPHPELWKRFLRGNYPELVANPKRDVALWHSSYVQTYLERDVRTLRNVGDLTQFQNFLRALAARSAQLLNLSELARDLGVAVNTAKTWLSVLEATYQVIVLRPYFANIGKRLVKTPKVYFLDVGTLCYLVGLRDPEHAASGPMGGAIMETAILSEIFKALTHKGFEPQVYFWRTSAGTEVDIIVDAAGKLVPVEAKLSATIRPDMASGIRVFQEDLGDRAAPGYIVHPGDVSLPLGPKVTALPFAEL